MAKLKTHYGKRWSRFCAWCLKKMGWTADGGPVPENKGIILGVPHTSVKDFLVSYFFYSSFGEVAHVMIKKEFFFWPLGPVLRSCGCIPVDRKGPGGMVKSLVTQMQGEEFFKLALAPEGTRKAAAKWKTGFLFIAKETGAPIYLGYFDWKTRHVGIGEKFIPTGDTKADLEAVQEHYRKMHLEGKKPEGYIYHGQ